MRIIRRYMFLFILIGIAVAAYLTYNTYGNWSFALQLRGKRIVAFGLVAIAVSFSTITLQTLTQNRYLTPGILGLDQLYVLIQTILFFFLGGIRMLSQETPFVFLFSILATGTLSSVIIQTFYKKANNQLFLLLMAGMISGTMFTSISSFLQVIMDPNEYDLLQGRLFASFSNVNSQHLLLAAGIILIGLIGLSLLIPELNVMVLGVRNAKSLGLSVSMIQKSCLFLLSLLSGTATALVGPSVFLGFVVATIAYQLFPTYKHGTLFVGSALLGFLLLVGGQFFVEQVFQWNTTINTVIQFLGGIFFLGKLVKERKGQ
ncbi:iron chelate uptake ABC transporter family permease subunit [Enterococcus gallinarum]|uniref:iron chelate uptake ABC transporter family permease subunit n=1 Tax=Enterococcus gallinarum TaxID=1353 RepID=UPI001E601076